MTGVPHPLDPLTSGEFRAAAAAVRRGRGVGARWRFASIELIEPGKDALAAHPAGGPAGRKALVVCWNRDDGLAYRAVVSLADGTVEAWEHLPGSSTATRHWTWRRDSPAAAPQGCGHGLPPSTTWCWPLLNEPIECGQDEPGHWYSKVRSTGRYTAV